MADALPQRGRCDECGTELAPAALACPGCRRLVHSDRLSDLAARARRAERDGDTAAALAAWREAVDLLPTGTTQHERVRSEVERLVGRLDAGERPPGKDDRPHWLPKAGAIGAVALLLWKLKAVLAFLATKGKLLLGGLTKGGTLFSMVASLGLYWTIWGWKFALGLVLSIYVHEMGHVAELRRRGYPASAPMFIPGLGAVVRLKQHPATTIEDARIGLAGPTWGLGAAVLCWLGGLALELPILLAIAQVGAWINLFNMLPVWQLDGARGFAALVRWQRAVATGVVAVAFVVTGDGLLLLVGIASAVRCFVGPFPERGDRVGLAHHAALVATLSALTLIDVPGLGG